MTVKFAKRVAAQLSKRGESTIRINPVSMEEVKKAMTREDVRKLLKDGAIYALKPKHNLSLSSKKLKIRRAKGRSRGPGKRKGTRKTRQGTLWIKRSRSQRLLLKKLRSMGKIDRQVFNKYYMLIKGGTFADKGSILLHLKEDGITVTDEEKKQIAEFAKSSYEKRRG
jgi:large subunit ribosomal protein L19e